MNSEIRTNIRLCGIIAGNILLNYPTAKHTKKMWSNIKGIMEVLLELKIYLPSLKILYKLINNNTDIIPIVKDAVLYNRDNEFIDVIATLNILIESEKVGISKDIKITWLEIILERICVINDGEQSVKQLTNTIRNLSKEDFNIILPYIIILLEKSLEYTVIQEYDDEEDVIEKLTFKSAISAFVNILYKKNFTSDSKLNELVMIWKEKCEGKNVRAKMNL